MIILYLGVKWFKSLILCLCAAAFFSSAVAVAETSPNGKSQGTSGPATIYLTSNKTPDEAKKSEPPKPQIDTVLKEKMDEAFQVLESIKTDKSLDPAQKKQKAIGFLRNFRWGWPGHSKKEFYFFVLDMQGMLVVEPSRPQLMGKNLMEFEDPNGTRVFAEMIKLCGEQKQGVVTYLWPEFSGGKPLTKTSIVRLFESWGWIVGTGTDPDTFQIEAWEEGGSPGGILPGGMEFDDRAPASSI